MTKEHNFGQIEDLDQYVQLSAGGEGRPVASIWYMAHLRPGVGPDLKAAVESEKLRERLASGLRQSACKNYGDFISVGGVVELNVSAYSGRKYPVDPQNDAQSAKGDVIEIRVDRC